MRLTALDQLLAGADQQPALSDGALRRYNRSQLREVVTATAERLQAAGVQRLALLADNGPDWVIADLAALMAGVVLVPVPPFFTPAQQQHLLSAAAIDALLAPAGVAAQFGALAEQPLLGLMLSRLQPPTPVALPAASAKITFTSGTTGNPKGVCLGASHQLRTAQALAAATAGVVHRRHLCLLPLSLLLENVAGVYAPLLNHNEVVVPPLAAVGLSGSSTFAAATAVTALELHGATSCVLVPEMLRALLAELASGRACPSALTFVAVGGGRVSEQLLAQAEALGLPLYQGYGLSECGSVVALNRPGHNRRGSVGQPLPHVQLMVASDGLIRIRGNSFLGYLGDELASGSDSDEVDSGDLGHLDGDGYLYLDGRRKHQLITAYGRNVAPEWPEAELQAEGAVAQALVTGDGLPQLVALLTAAPTISDQQLAAAVARANQRLPDYARIGAFVRTPLWSPASGLITSNGRPRRDRLAHHFATELTALAAQVAGELTS